MRSASAEVDRFLASRQRLEAARVSQSRSPGYKVVPAEQRLHLAPINWLSLMRITGFIIPAKRV
jgi:hypothetical protein